MFNLLVTADGDAWEEPAASMPANRFKEYSGVEAEAISPSDISLRSLEELQTLLMYETHAGGPNPRLVRHGKLRNIRRSGTDIHFQFEPDPQSGYLTRGLVEEFAEQLGVHHFEQYRTHWAIKDGVLPTGLLAHATPSPPIRNLETVAKEYAEAEERNFTQSIGRLRGEFEEFPPSTEKASFFLRRQEHRPLEAYPILGLDRPVAYIRSVINNLSAVSESPDDEIAYELIDSFSLAWAFNTYFGKLNPQGLQQAVNDCRALLIQLLADDVDHPEPTSAIFSAQALWKAARSGVGARRLRREVNHLLDQLALLQLEEGAWRSQENDIDLKVTAMATVAVQRLGDDRFREAARKAVLCLFGHQNPDGGIGETPGSKGSSFTTVLALEAARRSALAGDLREEIDRGEAWLLRNQKPSGAWEAGLTSLKEAGVTTVILEYFNRRTAFLAQVDGFFLMARDFFRKAEELALDASTNNRRLSAIAAVHALEMFLYGIFELREDLGLSAYRENGQETLGVRESLGMLQSRMRDAGLLPAPRSLKFRDQVTSMVSRRDSIIHRAHEISEEELTLGLHHIRSFIEEYGALLVSKDLLQ